MEDEPLDQLQDQLLGEPLDEFLDELDQNPRKYTVGQPIIDTVKKRKGAVIAFGAWVQREGYLVWEYWCSYQWYTWDDLNGDSVTWQLLQIPQHDYPGEDELRKVEDFKVLEDVIHPGLKLRGTVQNFGWKEVAETYVYQCLWKWKTTELEGPETTWNKLPMPTVGYPEEHELQKDFQNGASMTY